MDIFGIPMFITFDSYRAYLSENFPMLLNLTDDGLLISYLFVNFMNIVRIILIIVVVYKICVYIKNHYCL